MTRSSFWILILVLFLNILTGCGYNRSFGRFYKNQMIEVNNKHDKNTARIVKTAQVPFYLFVYFAGGLGTFFDVPNWKQNFVDPETNIFTGRKEKSNKQNEVAND
ncbi:MAG: hypothetical protein EBT63_01275 [Proteobacteria bacterium]|nr:hypothetical protein [Pseudomonadota bacterium]NCA27828.1 hypothetical protein [Pseudomonadota bacterium]